jgi:hypothetical protein
MQGASGESSGGRVRSGPILDHVAHIKNEGSAPGDEERLTQADAADQLGCDAEWEDQEANELEHSTDAIASSLIDRSLFTRSPGLGRSSAFLAPSAVLGHRRTLLSIPGPS